MSKRLLLCCVLLLAACAPASENQSAATVDPHNPPTVAPPEYVEAEQPISQENAARLSYLGRLDQPGRASTIFAHTFSPDGTRLAALDNELLLAWNLITGDLIFSTARGDAVQVYYSSDKTEIYALGGGGMVQIYDAERGRQQNEFRAHTRYSAADFFSDEGWLAIGGAGGEVKVWDTFERLSLITFRAHAIRIIATAFSPDGGLLATAAEDGIVSLWDWREGEQVAEFDHEGAPILSLAFAPDGEQLAVGTDTYTALWSLSEQTLIAALPTGGGGISEVMLYSPDGRFLVTGGRPEDVTVWDTKAAEMVAVLPDMGGDRLSAAFSPDGNLLLISLLYGPVALWDMSQITEETIQRADLDVEVDSILTVDWTDDGFLLALIDAMGPVYIWGVQE